MRDGRQRQSHGGGAVRWCGRPPAWHLACGFRHLAAAEWKHNCCDTLRRNQAKGYPLIDEDMRIIEGDAVPVELARVVAASVACALREDTARKQVDALLASELVETVSHEAALI